MVIFASLGGPAAAQTRAAAVETARVVAGSRTSCLALLTDAEVATAVGRNDAAGRMTESTPGSSQCRWEWPDADSSVTAIFADENAIRTGAAVTKCCPNGSVSAVAQFFEHSVKLEQDLGSDLPVPLSGIGQRAALFFDDAFLKLIVQTSDGVAQLIVVHVTREQLLALARAMVQP